MLTKRLDGLWADKLGFIAAIMLKWNREEKNGVKHYTFLLNAFNTLPHDIVSNGEDDSVLLTPDMYDLLLARSVCRPITDEEATHAIKNDPDVIQTNEELAVKNAEAQKLLALKEEEAAKTKAATSAKSPAVPKTVQLAPQEGMTEEQAKAITVAANAAVVKKE